jgi:hypothetical protein
MTKKIIWVFLFLIPGLKLQGQKILAEEKEEFVCSYYDEPVELPVTSFNSESEAETIIKNIVEIVGLKPNFEVRAAEIPNAAAVIRGNKRLILYNPGFTNRIDKVAGSKWASISILAHEVGHHLNGHTLLESGSRPDIELEADEFSGFVLRKMGATLNDAQLAMNIAASTKASHTHPAKESRLKAIKNGWNTANDQVAGRSIAPKTDKHIQKPAEVKRPVPKDEDILAEKYIAYDVYFFADPSSKYYVTIRNHLVKVEGGNLFVAASMAKSNKKKYTAMFYDKQYNYLYITSSGDILNGASRKVGEMKKHISS